MRAWSFLLLLLTPLASWGAITDQPTQSGAAILYDDIQAVCRTLKDAGMKGNIAALSKCYAATTNADIREAITAASGLFWLLRQEVAEVDRYAEHLRKNFPNSKYQILLEKSANLDACTNCQSGIAKIPCPDCGGTGKCRVCSGRGKVASIAAGSTLMNANITTSFAKPGTGSTGGGVATRPSVGGTPRTLSVPALGGSDPATQLPCSICGGSGTCKSCKGTKLGRGKCPFCQGLATLFVPTRTRQAYKDMLEQVQRLALAAGMAERHMVRLDGRWHDAGTAAGLLRQRQEELADFVRLTAEAELAKDYPTALQLLDNALARHPDSTYTADVQRVKNLLQADAEDKKLPAKTIRGQDLLDALNLNPRREIGIAIEAVLTACHLSTNAPLFLASQSKPVLPENPEKWQVGEPVLIDRAARVSVQIERPSRSGFLISELWEFRMIFENSQWKVWQAQGP